MKEVEESDGSYDGEDCNEDESEEEQQKPEPKIYEVSQAKGGDDDEENIHDLINIEIGKEKDSDKQQKITAVHSSISETNEVMGALKNNRT